MTGLVEINKDVYVFPYEADKTIELDTHGKADNFNYLTAAEARKLAAALIHMADEVDPENREIYPVDAYTLDVYKREADEALEKAHVWHPCNPELDHENNEIYKAKLAEIGRWILGYSKDAAK